MISASGSTESLSSQWQRKGKKRGGKKGEEALIKRAQGRMERRSRKDR